MGTRSDGMSPVKYGESAHNRGLGTRIASTFISSLRYRSEVANHRGSFPRIGEDTDLLPGRNTGTPSDFTMTRILNRD